MSNGFPFAAIIGRNEIMSEAGASFISSSYWTDGIGTAAALAVLEKMKRLNVHQVIWKRGIKLQEALKNLADCHPSCKLLIGGMPTTPTMTFQLGKESLAAKTLYTRKMLENGFLVSSTFYLMYAHEEQYIAKLIDVLDIVLGEIEQVIAAGQLIDKELGNQSQPGFARLA
jgi:glutamate-1-semialdehyde 2,1-aminomutase